MALDKKIIASIGKLPKSAKSVQFLSKAAEQYTKAGISDLPLVADNKNEPRSLKARVKPRPKLSATA